MTPVRTVSLPSCPAQKSTLIKLSSIRAVEKVEEKSFGSSHVLQVLYTDDSGRLQTAYLQGKVGAARGAAGMAREGWREDGASHPPPCHPPPPPPSGTAGV